MRDTSCTDRDYTAIRLVAERYTELQGLRLVLIGSVYAVSAAAYVVGAAPSGVSLLVTVAAALTVIFTGMWWLDRYYISTFGRVVQPARRQDFWRIAVIVVATTLGNQAFGIGPVPVFVMIAGSFALHIAIRDWPLRRHHLLAVVAAAVGICIQFTSPMSSREVAEALGVVICGAAYVPVGLLDHHLLVAVMRVPGRAGLKSCATEETKEPQAE